MRCTSLYSKSPSEEVYLGAPAVQRKLDGFNPDLNCNGCRGGLCFKEKMDEDVRGCTQVAKIHKRKTALALRHIEVLIEKLHGQIYAIIYILYVLCI